jgi:hypothetical protein
MYGSEFNRHQKGLCKTILLVYNAFSSRISQVPDEHDSPICGARMIDRCYYWRRPKGIWY